MRSWPVHLLDGQHIHRRWIQMFQPSTTNRHFVSSVQNGIEWTNKKEKTEKETPHPQLLLWVLLNSTMDIDMKQ